jgi:hypothetical protein
VEPDRAISRLNRAFLAGHSGATEKTPFAARECSMLMFRERCNYAAMPSRRSEGVYVECGPISDLMKPDLEATVRLASKINRKGDSMKGQIPAFVFAVCIASLVPTVVPTAQAKAPIRECSASPGKTQGHWSWRLIDGRKCWYAGKAVIAKASLRWPAAAQARAAQAKAAEARTVDAKTVDVKAGNLTAADVKAAQARPAPTTVGVATEKRGNPMDAQARMLDDDSFESRWRARVSTE